MKNIYKVLLFLPVIFLFFFISPACKKVVENKIVGSWKLVHVDNLNNMTNNQWVFTDSKEVFFDTLTYSNTSVNLDHGQYKIITEMGKKYVDITNCGSELNNHKYRIMKLNKKIMKLIIESKYGLTFFEFTKAD